MYTDVLSLGSLKIKLKNKSMKQVNLPLPNVDESEPIDIKVVVGKNMINFKVESFLWEVEDELSEDKDSTAVSLARITRLKKSIQNYDKTWELLQIFAPLENSGYIRVLYRKRN